MLGGLELEAEKKTSRALCRGVNTTAVWLVSSACSLRPVSSSPWRLTPGSPSASASAEPTNAKRHRRSFLVCVQSSWSYFVGGSNSSWGRSAIIQRHARTSTKNQTPPRKVSQSGVCWYQARPPPADSIVHGQGRVPPTHVPTFSGRASTAQRQSHWTDAHTADLSARVQTRSFRAANRVCFGALTPWQVLKMHTHTNTVSI